MTTLRSITSGPHDLALSCSCIRPKIGAKSWLWRNRSQPQVLLGLGFKTKGPKPHGLRTSDLRRPLHQSSNLEGCSPVE